MTIHAVIFDLDGVIVSSDKIHYLSWKQLAEEEGIPFNRNDNRRCRGVSRMQSLEIILEKSVRAYSPEEKQTIAERKNRYFRERIETMMSPDDILPGVVEWLAELKVRQIRKAIGSSSKNARLVLNRIGLLNEFDVVVDGNDVTAGKPEPDIFLLASNRLGVKPGHCIVVEDATAGVEAALRAGMHVLALGAANDDKRAAWRAENLQTARFTEILRDGSEKNLAGFRQEPGS
jgi:beta-phosphoglucomutase